MKFERRIGVSVVVGALAAATLASPGVWGQTRETPTAETLVEQLASPRPDERSAAAEALREMGPDARAALEKASSSPDPAIAQQARSLLRTLAWHHADDPQGVRVLLENYRKQSEGEQLIAIHQVAAQGTPEAGIALVRILQQESDQGRRWAAVMALRERGREDDRRVLRELSPETANTALLCAIGWAWETEDPPKSIALYRRVMRMEAERPTQSVTDVGTVQLQEIGAVGPGGAQIQVRIQIQGQGQAPVMRQVRMTAPPQRLEELPLGPVVARLQQVAIATGDWQLLGEAWRSFVLHLQGEANWHPQAARMLLSMHARFGPLPGFASDLRMLEGQLNTPVDGYLLAQAARRGGMALLARELERAAFGQNVGRPVERSEVAVQLLQGFWLAPAEAEVRAMLSEPMPADLDPDVQRVLPVISHMTLAHIAGTRGAEGAAAAHLEKAIAAAQGLDDVAIRPLVPVASIGMDAAREHLHWRRLRAARAAGDEAEVGRQVEALVAMWASDPDVLFDLNDELRQRGRADDARKLYDAAMRPLREQAETPTTANQMNERAWVMARAGEDLETARGLARRAVEMEPDNAAYLDTLAEAEFRLGDAAEAVRLEEKALQLAPGMPFMKSQLERYRAGVQQ